jgi:hypothetical protein
MPKVKAPAAIASLLVVSAVALGACGSDSDSDAPSASSLVGTWSASQVGYGGEGQPALEGPYPSTFVIKKADDSSRSFTGERVVSAADAKKFDIPASSVPIAGEIAPWGEISIVHSEGTWTLEMDEDSDDKMQGRYLENGKDLAAKSLTLTREK